MHVVINVDNLDGHTVGISPGAAQQVRMSFNPSAKPEVETLKALAAAFITTCNAVMGANPDAGRHAALAKTAVEEAAMWGVKAATAAAPD